jgi:hypothetical protein
VGAIALSLAACQAANQPKLVESQKSPVELRALQSRAFETTNREKTLRAVIATLQDLGYSIDKVEPSAGTITGTKLSQLRLTATVYPRGESRMMVRANAIVRMPQQTIETQVDDPLFYQQLFFEPLAKAMFLSALQVEDPGEPPAPAGATAATAIAPQSATNSKQGN